MEVQLRGRARDIGAGMAAAGLVVVALGAGAFGCSGGGNETADTGTDTETVPDLEAPDPVDERNWTVETIEGGGVGLLLDLETGPDGEVGVAYYATQPEEDGPCDELGEDPPTRQLFPMHYAATSGGDWNVETVYEPPIVGGPQALDLAFDSGGNATVATMTGEPLEALGWCGVHDLSWMVRDSEGDWQSETAVEESGRASNEETDEVSDFGEVVGPWASLVFEGDEPIIAYKDVHQGGRQSSDTKRADLELTRRGGGGWPAVPVDWGRGAGNGAEVAVDGEGRVVIAYLLPTESDDDDQLGVWVARSSTDDDSWTKTRIYGEPTPASPSMVVREDGRIDVLTYNADRGFPQLVSLEEPSDFEDPGVWQTTDIGDGQYDEGDNPSLAMAPDGGLAAAYRRCGRASDSDCKRADDGVVYARQQDGEWNREFVAGGDDAFCGHAVSLAFADGTPRVAFRCNVHSGDEVASAVQVAEPEDSK